MKAYKINRIMPIETYQMMTFLLIAIISYASFWYLFEDKTPLISKKFYSLSFLLFVAMAFILLPIYLISHWAMSILAGIGIGCWGALLYHSSKIRKEEREKKWKIKN